MKPIYTNKNNTNYIILDIKYLIHVLTYFNTGGVSSWTAQIKVKIKFNCDVQNTILLRHDS